MIEKIADTGKRALLWFSSKPNRLRVRGTRIEVMAFLVTRSPQPSILLGQSSYHDMWMPPQEGVNLSESFPQALHRCLEIECGLDLPIDPKSFARAMHVRSYRFIGIVDLPKERRGERPVADDAVGTALESVSLRRKAYWMATVILKDQSDITPSPDGKELIALRWFTFPDAEKIIRETNHLEKAELLTRALHACERDILGGMSPSERAALLKDVS